MIEVKGLKFRYTDKELFKEVDFRILPGEHIVLVGPNGIGKSTFLKLLAKELKPDFGSITWYPKMQIGYLDQHLVSHNDKKVSTYLLEVYKDLFAKENEMEKFYELAAVDQTNSDKYINYATAISEELIDKDFYRIKSSVSEVINGLGLQGCEDRLLGNLSGGQRAKVYLAKLLLSEYDCIILDEPTNFLDSAHIDFLTKYLTNYAKAFIVVSHDYAFCSTLAKIVYELNNGVIERYKGTFDFYLDERGLRAEHYEKRAIAQEKLIKKTQEFIDKNIVRASTTKRAQSRRKMLDKIVVLEKPKHSSKITFHFPFSRPLGIEVIKVNNLVIGYDRPLLNPLNFIIRFPSKVAITGYNGIGKTTLIKTLLSITPKISGDFKLIDNINLNYYAQDYNMPKISVLEYVRNQYPELDDLAIRSLLAKVDIKKEMTFKTMDTLSGGQLTKINLALLMVKKSNVLILDEPTNHLDEYAKESLKKALMEYHGLVIVVSHEESFYKDWVNQIIDLEKF